MARATKYSLHYYDDKPLMRAEEKSERIAEGHAKSFQKSVEIEEGNLYGVRTGKPFMGKPCIRWYVATMDEILEEVDTKEEAIEKCLYICMDGRKHPVVKRLNFGFYEYTAPRDYEGSKGTLWIGTRENLLVQGFDTQLDEWEREAEMPD